MCNPHFLKLKDVRRICVESPTTFVLNKSHKKIISCNVQSNILSLIEVLVVLGSVGL